jgi:hypothetical protein
VALIVLFEVFRAYRRRRMEVGFAWQRFDDRLSALRLPEGDIAFLRGIAEESQTLAPDTILQSPTLFEAVLELYYKEKGLDSLPDADLERIRKLRAELHFWPLSKEIPFTSTRQFPVGAKVATRVPEKAKDKHFGESLDVNEKTWSVKLREHIEVPRKSWAIVQLTRDGDAEYTVRAPVLSVRGIELFLGHTKDIKRMQMRNWVRIDVRFSVKVFKLSEAESRGSIEDMMVGTVLDLSGGGLSFSIPEKLGRGDHLSLEFDLPGHGVLRDVRVSVVRVVPPRRAGDVLCLHSVVFEEGEDFRPKQEQIIQYVFEQQRYNARMMEKN